MESLAPVEGTRLRVRNLELLELARRRLDEGDPSLTDAIKRLQSEADQALQQGPFTVVDKRELPPSGDKHDYVSMGPYWWPNPDAADGLPYVRRDGEVNPESNGLDHSTLAAMTKTVAVLSLGWQSVLSYGGVWTDYVRVCKTIDVLIGTFCAEHNLQLIHFDSDFDQMAKHIGLDII